MNEISDSQRIQLRHLMKSNLSNYLRVDNQIDKLQKQINELKKTRNKSEKSLEELGQVLSLENEQLRYHGETINFSYNCQKPGLSNNLIKQSLDNYLSSTEEWRQLPVSNFLEIILERISQYKDILAKDKKKNLKIKRVRNKS